MEQTEKKYMMYKAPLALNSLRKTIHIYKEKQCTTGVEQPAHNPYIQTTYRQTEGWIDGQNRQKDRQASNTVSSSMNRNFSLKCTVHVIWY